MRTLLPFAFAWLLVVSGVVWASPPDYGPQYSIHSGGSEIDVGYYGAPCVVDWDVDGYKDLVLGQFSSGYIRFYANHDTNDSPVFDGYEYIEADGGRISVPSG
ncbi:hypothetical protein GF402_08335 [Candidatus Fermentibacteria bacterium]|nr:hypothetical protein [Candidatus Fermentibacteria bacterium]